MMRRVAGQDLSWQNTLLRITNMASIVILLVAIVLAIQTDADFFVTADQRGQRLLDQGEYSKAAETFADPYRQAEAYYRFGDFEKAASIYGGVPGAEAAYNQANALMMMGKYEDAIADYETSLKSRPNWEAAKFNREIAKGRAERLRFEGGDMTGGMLGADEIVFDQGRSAPDTDQTETVEGSVELSDEEMRMMWLRQVQTTPGDFLKAKFAYQLAAERENASPSDD